MRIRLDITNGSDGRPSEAQPAERQRPGRLAHVNPELIALLRGEVDPDSNDRQSANTIDHKAELLPSWLPWTALVLWAGLCVFIVLGGWSWLLIPNQPRPEAGAGLIEPHVIQRPKSPRPDLRL